MRTYRGPRPPQEFNRFERQVAKGLGLTIAQLGTLLRLSGRDRVSGGTAGEALERRGLATEYDQVVGKRHLTPQGAEVLARARAMGF